MLLSLPLQLKSLNFNDFYSCGHRREDEERDGEEEERKLDWKRHKKRKLSWLTDIKERRKRNTRQAIPCLYQEDPTTTVYAKKHHNNDPVPEQ